MPSDTIKNPKEQVNVVNLRNGNKGLNEALKNMGSENRIKSCPHCGSQTAGQPSHSGYRAPVCVRVNSGEKSAF
jgi:hypothetical protein